MFINRQWLVARGACDEGVEEFHSVFPDGVEIVKGMQFPEELRRYQSWLAGTFQGPAWRAYKEIEGPALRAYKEIQGPALRAYEEIQGPAWRAYKEIEGPALRAYEEIQGQAIIEALLVSVTQTENCNAYT